MTSQSFSQPRRNVTPEPRGNGGNGFASQRWIESAGGLMVTCQDVKNCLFPRLRPGIDADLHVIATGFNQRLPRTVHDISGP